MRLMVMFDLPVETAKQKKNYRLFRKALINEGFLMMQYSIYVRICINRQSINALETKIKSFIPKDGTVQTLVLTENQYNSMHFLSGNRTDDVKNNSKRTIIL